MQRLECRADDVIISDKAIKLQNLSKSFRTQSNWFVYNWRWKSSCLPQTPEVLEFIMAAVGKQ